MQITAEVRYLEDARLQAVALPYVGPSDRDDEVSLIVVLPRNRAGLAALEASLTAPHLQECMRLLDVPRPADESMPKS